MSQPSTTSPPGPRLIVNADDFGLARCVNRGILRAHENGILTSATLLANGPAFDDAVALARAAPGLGIGVHLNLVRGRPLSEPSAVADLLGPDGRFDFPAFLARLRRPADGPAKEALLAQAAREYAAQIARVREAGIVPTHFDGEQHHHRRPVLMRAAAEAARAAGLPACRHLREPVFRALRSMGWPGAGRAWRAALLRVYVDLRGPDIALARPRGLLGQTHIGRMTTGPWLGLLSNPPAGIHEVMVHPGEYDAEEMSRVAREMGPSWIDPARPAELSALCDDAVRRAAAGRLESFAVFRLPVQEVLI